MPTYDLKCKDCDNVFEIVCSISSRDDQSCPECESTNHQAHFTQGPPIGDPVRLGIRTVDDGFREVLSKINERMPKSNLKDKLSRR